MSFFVYVDLTNTMYDSFIIINIKVYPHFIVDY